ncbi:DUF7351 domain-containing protein [Halogranum rubrum]|nr:hypothetical protein [Halogranum rubrum]
MTPPPTDVDDTADASDSADTDDCEESHESSGSPEMDPVDAFAALSDPIRVETIRVLASEFRTSPDDPVLAFSTLRRRVGVDDPGQFLYHLKRLLGTFVEKTDAGYRLTEAGHAAVAAMVAGTYTRDVTLGPTPLDSDCPLCAADVVARYAEGVLSVTCRRDHPLFVWSLPPNAAADAELTELVDVARLHLSHVVELLLAGSCPSCWSAATTRIEGLGDETASLRFTATCDTCGARVVGPVGFAVLGHAAVDAFYHRHGTAPRDRWLWELSFVHPHAAVELTDVAARGDETERGDGLARVELTVELADETLVVSLDETAHVVSTRIESSRPN